MSENIMDHCQTAKEKPSLREAQGYSGITKEKCIKMGFCFDDSIPNVPHCFSGTNPTKSVVLDLESLSKKYDTLLNEYNQVQVDYVNYLSILPKNLSQNNQQFATIKGSTFWGTKDLQTTNTTTLEECSALCSSTSSCSGATFNATAYGQPFCWLRTGDGTISTGLGGSDEYADYAIVSKGKQYLQNLQILNIQLTDINNKILSIINQAEPLYNEQDNQRTTKGELLKKNYYKLDGERKKINEIIHEYESLDEGQINGNLKIYSYYYYYILLLILVVILLFVLGGFYFGNKSNENIIASGGGILNNNTYIFIFLLILISLVVFFLKK